jgi:hypothetical protein
MAPGPLGVAALTSPAPAVVTVVVHCARHWLAESGRIGLVGRVGVATPVGVGMGG